MGQQRRAVWANNGGLWASAKQAGTAYIWPEIFERRVWARHRLLRLKGVGSVMVSQVAQTTKALTETKPPSPVLKFTQTPAADTSNAAARVAYTFSRCFWTGFDLKRQHRTL